MITLEEIARMQDNCITPAVAAEFIGCDPQFIRDAALMDPNRLPFPTIRCGNRTKIPRLTFLQAMGWRAAT